MHYEPCKASTLPPLHKAPFRLFLTVVVGLGAGTIIGAATEYCTSSAYYPVQVRPHTVGMYNERRLPIKTLCQLHRDGCAINMIQGP